MAICFKGKHFPKSIVLTSIRWYLSFKPSLRELEEIMAERGVEPDHFTIHRWVNRHTPEFEAKTRKRKKSVDQSWRRDEMEIKVKGELKWLYRALAKDGDTTDPYCQRSGIGRRLYVF